MSKKWLMLLFLGLFMNFQMVQAEEQDIVYTAMTGTLSDAFGDGTKENPYNRFEDAMENVADGGTIYILNSDSAMINDPGDDMPFIFTKSVTIEPEPGTESAVLVSRAAGMLLEADVTFHNIELDFANFYHDQIFANGYTLTLNNVTRNSGYRLIDLVAGGLYTADGMAVGTSAGAKGQIFIEGKKSEFGNLYAGSINGNFAGNAVISVKDAKGATIGEIYASGAAEAVYDRDNWFDMEEPPEPEADAEKYQVTGAVQVLYEKASLKKIDGAGAAGGTAVSFKTEYPVYNLTLLNLTKLSVLEGTLAPAALTVCEGKSFDLEIAEAGTMDFSSMGDFEVNNFTGGGKMVLGKTALLKITGEVTGETAFETSGGFNGYSGLAEEDHVYIETPADSTGIFTFVPNGAQEELILEREADGSWIVKKGETGPEVSFYYDTDSQRMGDVNINWETINPETDLPEGAVAEAKTGYHFVNWKDENGDVVSEEAHLIPQKTDGVYVEAWYWAYFAVNTYKVQFAKNDGTETAGAEQTFSYGEKKALQANGYSREGFEFKGWNTEKDGSGTFYEDQQEVENLTAVHEETIVLYAQWEEKEQETEKETESETESETETEPESETESESETELGGETESESEIETETETEIETIPPISSMEPIQDTEKNENEDTQQNVETGKKILLKKPKLTAKKKKKTVVIRISGTKDADGYEIYRSVKKKKGYRKIASVKRSVYRDKTKKKRSRYYYKVRAYVLVNGSKVYSKYSKVKSVKGL